MNKNKKAIIDININVEFDNKDFEICLLELKSKAGIPKHINLRKFQNKVH